MTNGLLLLFMFVSMAPSFTPSSRLSSPIAATVTPYGTFHSIGLNVSLAVEDDPDGDATAILEYRKHGDPYQKGLPLARIGDTRFVGSIFWLESGTKYDVRVTFNDPDGDPIDGRTIYRTVATRREIVIPEPINSYFASPSGSGSACSKARPCALTDALQKARAGDEVVLRGGIYYHGEINIPRSGIHDAPIVIRGFSGETAVLDGADPGPFTWTPLGQGVYRTALTVSEPHLILANGQRLYPYRTLTDLEHLRWDNTAGFYVEGTTLYVHLAGDRDPNDAEMVIARHNRAFYVEQDFIFFLSLTFRHYGRGGFANAIYFNNASDNLVQNSIFVSNDVGIGLKRGSDRNTIQDSEFYDTIFDWPWNAVKAEGRLEDGGVRFYDQTTGQGNVIRRNVFHDDFDGMHVCPPTSGAVTNETDIYDNVIYNMGDDGIETDGQCRNVRLWGNVIRNVETGISLAPALDGPVYALRNLITHTGAGNNSFPGTSFKFNVDSSPSGIMYLFHNTVASAPSGDSGLLIGAPGAWKQIYARNNIWVGTLHALHNSNSDQPVDLDYDNLWHQNGDILARWGGVKYASLADLVATTGQEQHGLAVEPAFVHTPNDDYSLRAESDLIDAGLPLPGINDDHSGAAPDIGAFEYSPLTIQGTASGGMSHSYNFTVTNALRIGQPPIDYTWHATDLGSITHTSLNFTDTISFTWGSLGVKTINVIASDSSGSIAGTPHTVAIMAEERDDDWNYLPAVLAFEAE